MGKKRPVVTPHGETYPHGRVRREGSLQGRSGAIPAVNLAWRIPAHRASHRIRVRSVPPKRFVLERTSGFDSRYSTVLRRFSNQSSRSDHNTTPRQTRIRQITTVQKSSRMARLTIANTSNTASTPPIIRNSGELIDSVMDLHTFSTIHHSLRRRAARSCKNPKK